MTAERWLVCGGRDFVNRELLEATMLKLLQRSRPEVLMHGDARGADTMIDTWAKANRINVMPFPISRREWDTYGKQAGPLRNIRMLEIGKPTLVIAFPGGKGTADMVRRARAADIEVIEVHA